MGALWAALILRPLLQKIHVREMTAINPYKEVSKIAQIAKYKAAEVAYHINHNLRALPAEKTPGNESIDPDLSQYNYSLLDRCHTSAAAMAYKKKIDKLCFAYKRKDVVRAVEVVIQCPADCPPEQEKKFFEEAYNYVCSTLPMGEKAVFLAQVHIDEKHKDLDGNIISKNHLHIMYVPAIPDAKHPGFEYKLCAHDLTDKKRLRDFHPGLQKHLDKCGITATVLRKQKTDGKTLSLSVKDLKEITKKTGIVLDRSITIDDLGNLLLQSRDIGKLRLENRELKDQLLALQKEQNLMREKLEMQKQMTADQTWGSNQSWGTDRGWGSDRKEDHIW